MRNTSDFEAGKESDSPFGTGPYGGDRETDFPNDNGWGSHMEQPLIGCRHCPAKFHFDVSRNAHEANKHIQDLPGKTEDMLF